MTEQTAVPAVEPETDDGWEWAIVEVMGHRRHAGRTREVERYGIKMIRVDVPVDGDPVAKGWSTHFYTGASLFGVTPCTEAAALKANRPYEPIGRLTYRGDPDDDGEGEP